MWPSSSCPGAFSACVYGCAASQCIAKVCDTGTCNAANPKQYCDTASKPEGVWTDCAGTTTCVSGSCVSPEKPLIVISQAYTGGNTTDATYKAKYLEIFNRGDKPAVLNNWSIQYASATGATISTLCSLPANISIPPKSYYLVALVVGSTGSADLTPSSDYTCSTTISASTTGGKLFIVDSNTKLSSTSPNAGSYVDALGYGSANWGETDPMPAIGKTTAAFRLNDGCTDTDNNKADFVIASPKARNSATPPTNCTAIQENSEANCKDGIDNDKDGKTDCADDSCLPFCTAPEDSVAACSDGLDNDGDGKTDCADDGCKGFDICKENTEAKCKDEIDNDLDGNTDCKDSDCSAFAHCATGKCAANETWLPVHETCAFNINTAAEFLSFRDNWNATGDATFKTPTNGTTKTIAFVLKNDIHLGSIDPWVGVGSTTTFTGIFDGGGKTITGILARNNTIGIFEQSTDAIIENLNTGCVISGKANNIVVGGIIATMNGGIVRNCHNMGSINGYTNGNNTVGGIVGLANGATIENCSSSANTSGGIYIGGILGRSALKPTVLSDVRYYKGSLTCANTFFHAGGIVGYATSALDITNASVESNIFCSYSNNVYDSNYVGGILGYASNTSTTFRNVSVKSDITLYGRYTGYGGGIIGYAVSTNKSRLERASYQGKLSVTSYNGNGEYAGGIAGYLKNMDIQNAMAVGTVNARTDSSFGGVVDEHHSGNIANVASLMSCTASTPTFSGISSKTTSTTLVNAYALPLAYGYGLCHIITSTSIIASYYNDARPATGTETTSINNASPYKLISNKPTLEDSTLVVDQLNKNLINKVVGLPDGKYLPWTEQIIDGVSHPVLKMDATDAELITIP